MKRFEVTINEIVNYQHKVVIEAESEQELQDALDKADEGGEYSARAFIHRLKCEVKVVDHTEDCFVDVVNYDNYSELKEEPTSILDLDKLEVGTSIYVNNGYWEGEIVEEEGQKKIKVLTTGKIFSIPKAPLDSPLWDEIFKD